MKSVTLRLNDQAGEMLQQVMDDQCQTTGSKALEICLASFLSNQSRIKNQWSVIEDLKGHIKELETTINHLR